jgi:dTDP-4-dehydrorhamnose 3,5-epimerase
MVAGHWGSARVTRRPSVQRGFLPPTPIPGVFIVAPERREHERGFFSRTWCVDEAALHGICVAWKECNVSFSKFSGPLRGVHFQRAPYAEGKLIRVTAGGIYDVALDLRPNSRAFKQHFAVTLTADNRLALYIPPAEIAHGFLTLENDTEVFYQMSVPYVAKFATGVRWNDPAFNITWPASVQVISERDAGYADFDAITE